MSPVGMGIQRDVKGRVAGTGYRVDAGAVAEAMLRRPSVHLLLGTRPIRPAGGARIPGPDAGRRPAL
jgi:hypothetical protein